MQCGDVTRAQQNTSRSWWPAGFQTPMMWSGSPSEWSGGACDACRPPSLLLFPVPLPTRARDALNVLRNTHKVSTMVIKDKDWATLKLQSRDRESERLQETKWESHLIYDLMTSWPHDLITSWTCEPHDLWTCEPMTMWPCDLLVSVSSAVWVVRHNNTQDLIKDLRGKWDFRFWWSIFSDLFLFTQFHMWHFFSPGFQLGSDSWFHTLEEKSSSFHGWNDYSGKPWNLKLDFQFWSSKSEAESVISPWIIFLSTSTIFYTSDTTQVA